MARLKQVENAKVKRGGKKASPNNVIEGNTVEGEAASQAGQTDGQDSQARPSSSTGFSGITLMSLALSVIALAGVAFLYYKIDTNARRAFSAHDDALARLDDVLGDRLDGFETRIFTLETVVGNLRQTADQTEAKIHESANASMNELTSVQSAMTARLNNVEVRLEDLLASGSLVPDADDQDNAASTDDLEGDPLSNQTMPNQLAVLIVMGLLSDNAAGRSLSRWVPALSSYAESDALSDRVEQVVKAAITSINTSPLTADSLLAEGVELAAVMAIGVNRAGDDASLFDRAKASLGQMLRIRSTRMTGDDPQSQLARFDLALSRHDLAAAADIAERWNGSAVEGLESWSRRSRDRFALDKALADLTAAIIGAVG